MALASVGVAPALGHSVPIDGERRWSHRVSEIAIAKSGCLCSLWGYRDSGPYLHDGRAQNLSEAVKFHKGQASESAERFARLSATGQSEIEEFLNSLAAPPSDEPEPAAHPGNRHSVLILRPVPRRPEGPASPSGACKARPAQERVAASRLKLAQSLEKMNKPEGALVFYREILRDEPDTAPPGSPPRESRLLPAVMRTERMSRREARVNRTTPSAGEDGRNIMITAAAAALIWICVETSRIIALSR